MFSPCHWWPNSCCYLPKARSTNEFSFCLMNLSYLARSCSEECKIRKWQAKREREARVWAKSLITFAFHISQFLISLAKLINQNQTLEKCLLFKRETKMKNRNRRQKFYCCSSLLTLMGRKRDAFCLTREEFRKPILTAHKKDLFRFDILANQAKVISPKQKRKVKIHSEFSHSNNWNWN